MKMQYQIMELDPHHLKKADRMWDGGEQDRVCFRPAKLDNINSNIQDSIEECMNVIEKNGNDFIADVSNSLLYDKLAVVIKTKSGKIFQVALDQEMSDVLYAELKDFFKGGIIKILPTEITSIDLD